MAYPRFLRSRNYKVAFGGSGVNFTANAATPAWQEITDADVQIKANTGDVVMMIASPNWKAIASATIGYMTFATMNGASRINVYNNYANGGAGQWQAPAENIDRNPTGIVFYTVQASDVISGLVKFRLMGATTGGTSRGIYNVLFTVINLGPQDQT